MNDDKTLLDSLAVEEAIQNDESYKFPYENYKIIGDTGEIDRIINTCGVINVDIIDITSTLSTEADNYVAVGYAEGEGCIANAFKDAVANCRQEWKVFLKCFPIYGFQKVLNSRGMKCLHLLI